MTEEEYSDRFKGTILGCAIGDSLGTPIEFLKHESIIEKFGGKVNTYIDPHILGDISTWVKGEYSDDTEMTLCIIDSIIEYRNVVPDKITQNFLKWLDSNPKDIGLLTKQTLLSIKMGRHWSSAAKEIWESEGGNKPGKNPRASNGSLMRCAPIGIYRFSNLKQLIEDSIVVSQITHYDDRCTYSNVVLNYLISKNIQHDNGTAPINNRNDILDSIKLIGKNSPKLKKSLQKVYKAINAFAKGKKQFSDILSEFYDKGGYVLDTLSIALICFYCTESFREAVIEAINTGSDNDTSGAVCGSLAGSYYGYDEIPLEWLRTLKKKDALVEKTDKLYCVTMGLNQCMIEVQIK
jgi:ADP-ribosyl-[dinitrogen reductase] hydrolase